MYKSPVKYLSGQACILLLVLSVISVSSPSQSYAQDEQDLVLTLHIDGTINPAIGTYIKRSFRRAHELRASLIVIQMNTPGGLDAAMRDIIQTILSSSCPVVTYISPNGARAASAGTYILYASHLAAMATATNLGAATPIQIGGSGLSREKGDESPGESDAGSAESTLERKIINDASAYIRGLADKHGRNGDWAVKAVREAVSLTALQALDLNVINIVADNLDDLLEQLDKRKVSINGRIIQLDTRNVRIQSLEQSWHIKLLSVIGDPTIAYILLLLGFYGLVYELANPGFLLPGVAGGIAIMLAFYAFQILPVNYSGLALMILGIVFLVSETFLPSFGTLGIGGIIAFSVGSLILIDEKTLRISPFTILGMAAVSTILLFLLVGRASLMRKKPPFTGREAMIGQVGVARTDFQETGQVWVNGESWNAKSSRNIKKGDKVTILSITGLNIIVEPLNEET